MIVCKFLNSKSSVQFGHIKKCAVYLLLIEKKILIFKSKDTERH